MVVLPDPVSPTIPTEDPNGMDKLNSSNELAHAQTIIKEENQRINNVVLSNNYKVYTRNKAISFYAPKQEILKKVNTSA